jgi:hypothetical protein
LGEEVFLLGGFEHRSEMEGRQNGMPFSDDKWNDMLDRLEKCGVDVAPWRAIEATPT